MKRLVVCKPVCAEDTEIGKGAEIAIDRASSPILQLLKRNYLEDHTTLKGDTAYLMSL